MEIFTVSYIVLTLFLLIAVNVYKSFVFQLNKNTFPATTPKLSLIIAAKNEEANIPSLIDSIENLNYPKENFEVIIVDDNSNDKTAQLIQSSISGKNNFTFIKANSKELEGKKGALNIGIKNSRYNFIVITDADCRPEVNWLNSVAGALDYGYDFVFGVAPITSGTALVEKLSSFENFRNTYLAISAVGMNIPYSAAARSFAFRKSSFERLGGYTKTTDTISGDDDLLLREAVKHKMLIGTFIEDDTFVYSAAPKNFGEYFLQKQRHLQTSFHYLLKQKMFLGFWHLINLVSLFSIALAFVSPVLILPFIIKLIYDLFIVLRHQKKLGHSFKFYEVIYLQILFEVFIIINFFNSLSGKSVWK
ncbi:MAG: glycosyltransferase [Ignavibacterium sp.]|nr:glycosyltransferase [Ignavibacterium sp.]